MNDSQINDIIDISIKRDLDLIEYYEIQEERMAREIRRLKGIINEKNLLIEELQNPENSKKLRMDGFNDCIEGVVERFGQPDIICYDKAKVLDKIMVESSCSYDEALEFYEFNQLGAWVGDTTPCFIDKSKPE